MGAIVATVASIAVACSATPLDDTTTQPVRTDAPSYASTSGDEGAASATGSSAPEIATTGVQRVWVSVVTATTTTSDDIRTIDRAAAEALVARMNEYWTAESNGVVSLTLGGFETRALGQSGCSGASTYSTGGAKAFSGRFANEKWRGTNDHLLLLSVESCGSAGIGSVGGAGGVIFSGNGTTGTGIPVALHEFGHNLGFGHAGSAICHATTPDGAVADFGDVASACPTDEYGDYLDIMGYSISGATPHLSSVERVRAGYLHDITDVSAASGAMTTTITPLDGGSANRVLRVTDPLTGVVYYVEYRTPTGEDATSTEFTSTLTCTGAGGWSSCSRGWTGGEVRVLRELPFAGYSTYTRTVVLAAGDVPGDPASRTTGLGAGATFTSANSGFYLHVDATAAGGATVSVRFSAPAATTSSLSAPTTARYGAAATVAVRVAAADGSAPSGSVQVLDGTDVVATGTVTAGTAAITLPTLAVGAHELTAQFTPSTGDALASASGAAQLTVAKATTKTTATVSAKLKKGKAPKVTVKVTGVVKPTGIIRVFIGSKLVKTVKVAAKAAGKITVTLPKQKKTGTLKISAKYYGSSTAAASTSAKKRVTVR